MYFVPLFLQVTCVNRKHSQAKLTFSVKMKTAKWGLLVFVFDKNYLIFEMAIMSFWPLSIGDD